MLNPIPSFLNPISQKAEALTLSANCIATKAISPTFPQELRAFQLNGFLGWIANSGTGKEED